MPLESASFISGLNPSNPAGNDLISAGDDHIRLIKAALVASFPNISGAVSASHVELSFLTGVMSPIQAQLDGKSALGHGHTEAEIADGTIFPRLGSNETITGLWNFTGVRPTIGGRNILDTASAVAESQITDANLLARVAGNESISGAWNFIGNSPLVGGLGMLRHVGAGLTGGRVHLQQTPPDPVGSPGDIVMVY